MSIHNEGYRDDTVPKTINTRRHCEVGLRVFNNLSQPPKTEMWGGGCGRLLHALNPLYFVVPSCVNSFWHGVIPTTYLIFTLVSVIFPSHKGSSQACGDVLLRMVAMSLFVTNYGSSTLRYEAGWCVNHGLQSN